MLSLSRENGCSDRDNASHQWLLAHWQDIDEMLAIVFLGRSGSVFLSSLLDNHPQIIMLPGTQLAFFYHFWETYGNLNNKKELIYNFCAYFATFFDAYAFSPLSVGAQPAVDLGFTQMGPARDERLEINKYKFIAVLSGILDGVGQVNRKNFFQAVHVAYTMALGRDKLLDQSKLPIIVYQLHMNWPSLVTQLHSDFPKTKMIHMIREPLQTIGSHFKHGNYNCNVMNKFHDDAFPYIDSNCSKAVKLEDLHTQPRMVLEKIIQWIGVKWEDSLLESTFNNKKWWNLKHVEQVHGFNQVIISKNHDEIYSNLDKYRLNILYSKRFNLWGYPSKMPSQWEIILLFPLLLIPFKMEIISWKKEIANRKWRGFIYVTLDWFHLKRRRNFLFKAWKYSLLKETKEVALL